MKLVKYGMIALFCMFMTSQANAGVYLGGLVGYGVTSGSPAFSSGGLALGGTAGFQLMPNLGIAATYIHNALKAGSADVTVTEIFAEANFFSLVFLPSGVHAGNVNTSVGGASASDIGAGAHTGLELMLTTSISVGASVYWTYVMTTNDKHSLINVLAPIKFHF